MDHIIIRLEVDEDGYPPFATERLWATKTANGFYKIDNIPFYARRIALGDIVSVRKIDDALYLQEVVQASANSTIRVVFFEKDRVALFEEGLRAIGCDWEWDRDRGVLAINVPSTAHYRELLHLIEKPGGEESVDYEESALRFNEADLG